MTTSRVLSSPELKDWYRERIANEPYWFHRIELAPDLITPGWSDPAKEKLPYYGLPDDMTGMRVLDIGPAEGFFSFEAERRGAREIIAVDSYVGSVERFTICKEVLGSKAVPYLTNVYDLSPKTFGTFDMVFFFGVLYHLRHPMLALERILSVCSGTLLMQTANYEHPGTEDIPMAKFFPAGMASGPADEGSPHFDPTVFWMPNSQCVNDMLLSVGFQDVRFLSMEAGVVYRASSPDKAPGTAPDPMKAPWS